MVEESREVPVWRECHDCGLLQHLPEIPTGEAAVCARCQALLRRVTPHSLAFARVNTACAAILFTLALGLPLIALDFPGGRTGASSVFSGPDALRQQGFALLAICTFVLLILTPALKLAVQLAVLFGMDDPRMARWLLRPFGWLGRVTPWAMVEVFFLGSLVAYSRLNALAHVEVGLAELAFGAAMVGMAAVDATLDRELIWQSLDAGGHAKDVDFRPRATDVAPEVTTDMKTEAIGCGECQRVNLAKEGEPCGRCGHRLHSRRPRLDRVWALVVASVLLYIPANVLPVMTIERMGKTEVTTILHGVVDLVQASLWPLALLVLVASIIVPVLKLASLIAMLVMTHRRSSWRLQGRTRLFRLVRYVGRWSMIDIFMLSVLVGVVRFGPIASVLPGEGAMAFCAVVLLTMTATELFDPRLMWDAGGRQGATEGKEASHAYA